MARTKGTVKYTSAFEVQAGIPLDARTIADSKESLISEDFWKSNDEYVYLYNGLVVAIPSEGTIWQLIDKTKYSKSDYSGWKCVGGSNDLVWTDDDTLGEF